MEGQEDQSGARQDGPRVIPAGWAYVFLALAMLFWVGNSLVARGLREAIEPISLNFLRWVVALALILPFSWRRTLAARADLLREWKIIGLLGLLGVGLYQTFLYQGLQSTTATNGSLFNSSIPVIVVGLSWLIYRDRVTGRQMAGILVSLAGVLVIIAQGDPAMLLDFRFNPGDIWIVASLPVWSLYTVLQRRRLAGIDQLALITATAMAGLVFLLPLFLVEYSLGVSMAFTPRTLAAVGYVAVFASLGGFILWNMGVQSVGANRGGLFLHLHPVFTVCLAIPILGERLHWFQGAGIALIFVGIFLTTRAPQAR